MKKIFILGISLCLCFYINAQFGIDVIVKQSAHESYSNPDAVETTGGNMFAIYLLDSAGIKGCELAMSVNSGINWTPIYRWFDSNVMINRVAITSTDTGANEKVVLLMVSQENIGFTSSLDVHYFNANNAYYITSTNVESGVSAQYGQIDIESDSKNINGSEGNFGFIVAYSGDVSDSVKYFCRNGIGFYKKKVATTGPGQLGNVHINYANNDNFSNHIFMMAWDELYGSSKVYMATTGTNMMPVGAIATMRVDDDIPTNTGLLHKPYVLTQNNGGLAPSGTGSYGLLHGLLYMRDSTGSNGANILGNVNKSYATFTTLADSCNPENSAVNTGDYAAVNFGTEAHVIYFNKTNHYLRWKSNTDVINNPSAAFVDEVIPGGRINDIPSITESPDPVVIYSPSHNRPGFFWVDNMSGRGAIKFDAPFIGSFSGIENLPAEKLLVFPNPVPSNGNINITTQPGWDDEIKAELLTINGRVYRQWISTGVNASAVWTLDPGETITPGVYILRISGKEINAVAKLIIQ